jgi:hypothetical protein
MSVPCRAKLGDGLFWQHLLNHQQTSQILCLPSSHSFQAYGSKPMRGHEMGQAKNGMASNRDNFGK